MFKHLYRSLPMLAAYGLLSVFLYSVVMFNVSNDTKILFDWAQIHTAGFVVLIGGCSLILWALTFYLLLQFNQIERIQGSQWYAIFTAIVFSIAVAAVSAMVFVIYHIDIHNPGKTIEWMQVYPERYLFTVFLLSLLTLAIIMLVGEAYLGAGITFVLYFILALVNYYKKIFRNEPLFPNDFIQASQLKEVIPMIKDSISIPIVIGVIGSIVVLIALWFFLPKIKIRWFLRIIMILPLIFLMKSFLFFEHSFAQKYYDQYAALMPWNQQNNYYYNGPVIGMISNVKTDVLQEPDDYSEEAMAKVAKRIQSKEEKTQESKAEVKPNVVFVMNETFWDPTKLNVTFSEDPMKNTRELQKKYPSGWSLSPSFGGETANVEFEALTSYSLSFFNPGGLPYQHVLSKKEYPSFVSYLEKQGYATTAMHPNSGMLYMRQNVYPNLGFDQVKFIDQMKHTQKDNKEFVSDEAVVDEVLDTLRQSKKPAFVHAVTIANHLPYSADKYNGQETIKVTGKGLSPEMQKEIEIYAEGIKRSDAALKRLNDEIQKLDEPTIVVFWGDHLPALGQNLQAYKETGFGNEKTQQTSQKFYQTPLLFLSNYDTKIDKNLGTMSPIYIAPTLAQSLGYKSNLFYDQLNQMKTEVPAFRSNMYIDSKGKLVDEPAALSKKAAKDLQDYHEVEFDTLSGKQYETHNLYK
ncbi:LTA synthase family protein [Priestia megaterium]|uniref:LTA synthase family protein n=1 Tax=Priestia megaterium TaxID=1404 RepID=UPI0025A4889A|nr:LTA synthase family protein [Priestia megaterium]MDM8149897.1 sulfatase-like hydrolase/transferase [Priestia megaterium]